MKSNDEVNEVRADARQIESAQLDPYRPPERTTGVLWLVIPYTTLELTRAALRHAGVCSDLDVHVSLVDVQVVPFPCALDQPAVNNEYSQRRLQELFSESGLPGHAAVLYTRDWLGGFRRALEPKSLVIVATKRCRWWTTRETRLARTLTKAGHQVMLLPVR